MVCPGHDIEYRKAPLSHEVTSVVLGKTLKGLLEDEHVNDGMNETVPCFMYIFKRHGSRHRV